jgi:S-ribosylhomocysteine lyase LuxS involved in autoinducer biosynthesis
MKFQDNNPQRMLDEAVSAIRNHEPEAEIMRSAGEHVWEHLANRAMRSLRGNPSAAALTCESCWSSIGMAN